MSPNGSFRLRNYYFWLGSFHKRFRLLCTFLVVLLGVNSAFPVPETDHFGSFLEFSSFSDKLTFHSFYRTYLCSLFTRFKDTPTSFSYCYFYSHFIFNEIALQSHYHHTWYSTSGKPIRMEKLTLKKWPKISFLIPKLRAFSCLHNIRGADKHALLMTNSSLPLSDPKYRERKRITTLFEFSSQFHHDHPILPSLYLGYTTSVFR